MKHVCLTFDVEEFTIPQYSNITTKYDNTCTFSNKGIKRLLALLKKYDIPATFFITGYYANRNKQIVKDIKNAGHEIGCHAYYDYELTKKSKSLLQKEIIRATKTLRTITKNEIFGFRAPRMAINRVGIDILKRLGYTYDSSRHPAFFPPKYFQLFSCRAIHKLGGITEIPVSVLPLIRTPISWWWFKNIGSWITKLGCILNRNFVNIYFHPWEFADIPLIKGIPSHFIRPCGSKYVDELENLIKFCKKRRYEFKKLKDIL